jgi:hypothetical protein
MSTPESRAQDAHDDLIGFAGLEATHGLCTACGSYEVELVRATGVLDLSYMGEASDYPTGYGCEVCS